MTQIAGTTSVSISGFFTSAESVIKIEFSNLQNPPRSDPYVSQPLKISLYQDFVLKDLIAESTNTIVPDLQFTPSDTLSLVSISSSSPTTFAQGVSITLEVRNYIPVLVGDFLTISFTNIEVVSGTGYSCSINSVVQACTLMSSSVKVTISTNSLPSLTSGSFTLLLSSMFNNPGCTKPIASFSASTETSSGNQLEYTTTDIVLSSLTAPNAFQSFYVVSRTSEVNS